MTIHPTAIVDKNAVIADDVTIGAYSIIDAHVTIGEGTVIGAHAIIHGKTTIGKNNTFHSHCVIGDTPQDLKFNGQPSELIIGDGNTIREFTTIHRGTQSTIIGNDNLLMAYSHVAHDCQLGSQNILSNGATLGGHVHLDDQITLGGLCAIHQYCRIGKGVMIAGGAMVVQDVPPISPRARRPRQTVWPQPHWIAP